MNSVKTFFVLLCVGKAPIKFLMTWHIVILINSCKKKWMGIEKNILTDSVLWIRTAANAKTSKNFKRNKYINNPMIDHYAIIIILMSKTGTLNYLKLNAYDPINNY